MPDPSEGPFRLIPRREEDAAAEDEGVGGRHAVGPADTVDGLLHPEDLRPAGQKDLSGQGGDVGRRGPLLLFQSVHPAKRFPSLQHHTPERLRRQEGKNRGGERIQATVATRMRMRPPPGQPSSSYQPLRE